MHINFPAKDVDHPGEVTLVYRVCDDEPLTKNYPSVLLKKWIVNPRISGISEH
jgi:hypothetical protein